MGRTDFAAGVSRDLGQQSWMPHSLARIHWLEGWDSAKQQGFQQTTFDFGDTSCKTETDQNHQ
jgi:hypothetical protein